MEYKYAARMGGLQASAIREILKYTVDPAVISFAAGNPAPEAFPTEIIGEITSRIMTSDPIGALQYSISEGYTPLRDKLKAQLKERYSIGTDKDELIVTSGAQEAIQLACKVLCDAGDTLVCENPSFIGSLNAFRSYEVNLVGVECEADGISVEALEETFKNNKNVKLLYLIPNFQNPSGATMSLAKRKAVYQLCVKYGVMILEDNPYGELRFAGENVPNIKSMDTEGIVIYVGSFSKILSPGLRVGFLCAPAPVVAKLVVLKQVSDVHTNILAQRICDSFLAEVDFDKHISGLRDIYRHKANLMISEMEKHLSKKITYNKPEGGLFIWCRLPDGIDMPDFCKQAVLGKVAIVPGTAFLPRDTDKTQCFRLNFSTPADEKIVKGVEILGALTKEIL